MYCISHETRLRKIGDVILIIGTLHFLAQLSHWLMVSYCNRWMSVICRQQLFKGHLLNYWLDFDQTWQE